MRWRTAEEVKSGKGVKICGNVDCWRDKHLTSYEVEFGYEEAGKMKKALVKLRLCRHCAKRVGWNEKKKKKSRKEERKEKDNGGVIVLDE